MQYMVKEPDAAIWVYSVHPGYFYDCSNLESVDRNLRKVLDYLGPRSNFTETRKVKLREDFNNLLARRLWLEMIEKGAA